MRRLIIGLTIGFGLLAALGVTSTAAAPTPSTTVVLSCDRGVGTAQATVALRTTAFDPVPFDTVVVSCGPDSISGLKSERTKVFTGSAGWFTANVSLTNAAGSGGCGIGSVPDTVTCDLVSGPPGVKLVVR